MKTWQFILILALLIALGALIVLTFLGYVLNIPAKQQQTSSAPEPKRLTTPPIDPTRDIVMGNEKNKVTVVAYMDFGCPHCKTLWNYLHELIRTNRGTIRLIWKDLPRQTQQGAQDAHTAARCAHEQNKFLEFTDMLYAAESNFSKTRLRLAATTLGLNLPRFTACQERDDHRARFTEIRDEAIALEITGTPTLFINNERLEGEVSRETLQAIIERAQTKLK